MSIEKFPTINSKQVKHFKILILFTLVVAMTIFILENKNYVLAFVNSNSSIPIYSVATDRQVVSITFDAAWGVEDLEQILTILENHNCKATFFVTGEWALKFPDAIKQIVEKGHEVGSHGENHKHMTQLSQSDMIEEINGCHEIIKELTDQDMILFRAPYGDYNETVVETATSLGYYTIQWDVDSLDWKDYGVDNIIDTVCNHESLQNGSIILLHNGSKYTALALDEMLTNLESMGYGFVPVSELIVKDNYEIDHTGRQRTK